MRPKDVQTVAELLEKNFTIYGYHETIMKLSENLHENISFYHKQKLTLKKENLGMAIENLEIALKKDFDKLRLASQINKIAIRFEFYFFLRISSSNIFFLNQECKSSLTTFQSLICFLMDPKTRFTPTRSICLSWKNRWMDPKSSRGSTMSCLLTFWGSNREPTLTWRFLSTKSSLDWSSQEYLKGYWRMKLQ